MWNHCDEQNVNIFVGSLLYYTYYRYFYNADPTKPLRYMFTLNNGGQDFITI